MKGINMAAQILLIIGGLNWGLVGLFDFNLVSATFGVDSVVSNIIYILVGLAALYGIYLLKPIMVGSDVRTPPRSSDRL